MIKQILKFQPGIQQQKIKEYWRVSHMSQPISGVKQQKQSKTKSSLRLKSKTPLQKDEVHKISTILMHLNNHNDSIDFRQPVDWKNLQLYDYLDVVKHPMDLGTINEKFKDKKYRTVEAVLNDIQLVWDNCKLYNPKNSDIYQLADKLQLSFRRMVKNYLPNLKVATVTSVPIRPITEPPFTIIYKPQRQNQKISFNIRRQFLDKLSLLAPANLEKIINAFKQYSPYSFIEGQQGWAKIQLQNIQATNFFKILNLLKEINGQKQSNQQMIQQS